MEAQAKENLETMDLKPPRKLNFNAPLLSTRRLGFSAVAGTSCSSSSLGALQNTSVPFSWEQAPGKPKDTEISDPIHDGGDTPRPRLPPCLWQPPKAAAEADAAGNGVLAFDQDDGCDGDDDDDSKDDVLSLSEALDIVRQLETSHKDSNDGLRSKLAESNGDRSPTYMINRFLPDATALAASSSAVHFPNDFSKKFVNTCSYPREAYLAGSSSHASSPKGCGMELVFPWRVKHKLCAVKSPVLTCSTNAHKHQHSSKSKEHCLSVHKNCKNVKGDI